MNNIIVLDDFYPDLTTGFRIAEYNHYLRVFPGLTVATTVDNFTKRHSQFRRMYPDLQNRVVKYRTALLAHAKLCYLNFLNNAYQHVESLETAALPFLFTLYPGGGFELRNEESRFKLNRVLRSPMLRAVISTQSVTADTLRELACSVPVIDCFGAAINPVYFEPQPLRANLDHAGRKTLNICFAAHKYDSKGCTKGYPVFIELASKLAERYGDIDFSVIGNYGPDDVSVPSSLQGRIHFRGLVSTLELREILLTQDLIISPNQPFAITGSAFDGFPTATCAEASLCGVAIVCSDELALNEFYGEDEIIICPARASDILDAIEPLMIDRRLIAEIGERGRRKSAVLFSAKAQLIERTRIIRKAAAQEGFAP